MENYGGAFTRSVTRLRRPMTDLSSLKQLVPPLSQNKAIVYFGDPIGSVEGRSGFAFGEE